MIVFNTITNQFQITSIFKKALHIVWCISFGISYFWKTSDDELFHRPLRAVEHSPLSTDRFCTVGSWTRRPEALKTQSPNETIELERSTKKGLPGGSAGKESACNTGDPGSIPGLGRSTGGGIGYPLQLNLCQFC